MQLYQWQQDALAAWNHAGRRGIVEAVTGTGKTMVGVAAIADVSRQGGYRYFNPLVVVPSAVLMQQWYARLTNLLPGIKIGRISKDYSDNYASCDVCIGIVNSVVKRLPDLFGHTGRNPQYRTLLVADECHHYIDAPVFNKVLKHYFHYTLGLSATAATDISWEVPGLGRIIKQYTFGDAGRDGLIPPFDLVNSSTHFTPNEERTYLDLSERITDQMSLVYELYGDQLPGYGDPLFFRKLRQLMLIDDGVEDPTIKKLFVLMFKRAAIVYQATNKLNLAMGLILLMLQYGKKVMVFFERIESTEEVADVARATTDKLKQQLTVAGVPWCKVYHSNLKDAERDAILEEFKTPGPKALLSCRSLDEGLDVPEVDCAILAASTQSRRQRIQRIGRVLRKGEGNKKSIIVTLFVEGSGDENVTADDAEIFQGPVTLHTEHEGGCFKKVEKLLEGQNSHST